MKDDLPKPANMHLFDLPEGETDEQRLSRLKRAIRDAAQAEALILAGFFTGGAASGDAQAELIGLLVDAPLPVVALASGSVGPRGLALLCTADRIVLSPDARVTDDWRTAPGLAPLLHHRFGAAFSRAALFNPSADPLALLVEQGAAIPSEAPGSLLREIGACLEGGVGRRIKRAFKASAEMPFREALTFDLWLTRREQQ